jgi:hypothetical protein
MNLDEILYIEHNKRKKRSKSAFNVSLCEERIKRIGDMLLSESNTFLLLNSSEKIDFMIYLLESYLIERGKLPPIIEE